MKKQLKKYFITKIKGSVSAMNNLGNIYRSGIGTEQEPHLALYYYTMAANKGDFGAMANLGSLYLNLNDVEKN